MHNFICAHTGDQSYLRKAEDYYERFGIGNSVEYGGMSYEKKNLGIHTLLFSITKKTKYRNIAKVRSEYLY